MLDLASVFAEVVFRQVFDAWQWLHSFLDCWPIIRLLLRLLRNYRVSLIFLCPYYCLKALKNLLKLVRIRDLSKGFELRQVRDLVCENCIHQNRVFDDIVKNQTANKVESQLSWFVRVCELQVEFVHFHRVFAYNRNMGPRKILRDADQLVETE
jgi:hypothetical protein